MKNNRTEEPSYWTTEGDNIRRGPDAKPIPADRKKQILILTASLIVELIALASLRAAFEMVKWN